MSELGGDVDIPPELELLTIKPIMEIVNGPDGTDLKLEAELNAKIAEVADDYEAMGRYAEELRAAGATVEVVDFDADDPTSPQRMVDEATAGGQAAINARRGAHAADS